VVGAIGRSRKGVQFDALDGKPVKLVMLFLVPQGQFQKHLHTLANLAKLLHKRISAIGCDALFARPAAWRSFTRKMIQNAGLNPFQGRNLPKAGTDPFLTPFGPSRQLLHNQDFRDGL